MPATAATIVFTGITYIMLSPAAPTTARVAVATLDLPDRAVTGQSSSETIPRHVPFIMVDESMVDKNQSTRTRDYVVNKTGTTVLWNVYLLHGEQIVLHNVSSSGVDKTVLPHRLKIDDYTPKLSEVCETCWLPPMKEFDQPNLKKYPHLAATMDIPGGHLAAMERAVNMNCVWRFPPEPTKTGRKDTPLAQEVAFDVEVTNGKKMEFGFIAFGAASETSKIVFNANAEVTVGSAPFEDVLFLGSSDPHTVDHHFGTYYYLLHGFNAGHPVPEKVDPHCMAMVHRMGGANCPPAME